MNEQPSAAARDAARLLGDRIDAQTRAAIIDRLLDDPQTLQALRASLPLAGPAERLAGKLARSAGWRRWFDGWSLAGMAGAAAAALMLLAAPAPLQQQGPQHLQADQQQLVADVLLNGSFEPTNDLFGGDFEG